MLSGGEPTVHPEIVEIIRSGLKREPLSADGEFHLPLTKEHGAVTGLGIESTSFRNGLPHESVLEMDVFTGAGEVVTTRPGEELFDAFAVDYLAARPPAGYSLSRLGDNFPDRGRHWIPSVDHPSDKALYKDGATNKFLVDGTWLFRQDGADRGYVDHFRIDPRLGDFRADPVHSLDAPQRPADLRLALSVGGRDRRGVANQPEHAGHRTARSGAESAGSPGGTYVGM